MMMNNFTYRQWFRLALFQLFNLIKIKGTNFATARTGSLNTLLIDKIINIVQGIKNTKSTILINPPVLTFFILIT